MSGSLKLLFCWHPDSQHTQAVLCRLPVDLSYARQTELAEDAGMSLCPAVATMYPADSCNCSVLLLEPRHAVREPCSPDPLKRTT